MKLIKSALMTLAVSLISLSVFAGPVNINKANAEALADNIVGVGEKLAVRIVTYRKENGPFKTVDELSGVKGVGPKLIEKNRKDLLLSDS